MILSLTENTHRRLVEIEVKFLLPCLVHKKGLPGVCTCPKEDPVEVIRELVLGVSLSRRVAQLEIAALLDYPHYEEWARQHRNFPLMNPRALEGLRAYLTQSAPPLRGLTTPVQIPSLR